MTIEVVFVSDKDVWAGDGHNTDSIAKKQPATAALNPDYNESVKKHLFKNADGSIYETYN